MYVRSLVLALTSFCSIHAASANDSSPGTDAAACVNDASWVAEQTPFRIHGDTWHVGPRGLGVFLIKAPTGHVLIDGGVPANAALVEKNLRSLGVDLHDIKWILNSQAHCDHAGAIAQLARDTGAQVIAGAADEALLARGGRDDPQFADRFTYAPVRVDRTVRDGEALRLGDLTLTAHATPGHTPGNTTWAWRSCEDGRCLDIVFVGSLSAPDYRLVDNAAYPGLADDFERSFAKVAALPCDLALAPHPGMIGFWERVEKQGRIDRTALVDPSQCRRYAERARDAFGKELARQHMAASRK